MARFRSVERVSEKSRMTTRRKVSSQTRCFPRSSLNPTIPLSPTHAGSLGVATSLPHAPQSLTKPPDLEQPYRASTKQHTTKPPIPTTSPRTQAPSRPKLTQSQRPGANPEAQQQPQSCPNPTNAKRTTSPYPLSFFPTTILIPSSPPLPILN